MYNLINKIKQWGIHKGINKCDPLLQITKTEEEITKLKRAIIRYEDFIRKYPNKETYMIDNSSNYHPVNEYTYHNNIMVRINPIKDAIGDIFVMLVMLDLQYSNDYKGDLLQTFQRYELIPKIPGGVAKYPLLSASNIMHEISKTIGESGIMGRISLIENKQDIIWELDHIAKYYNLSLKECVEHAYNEIKDRQGKIVDGLWEKEQ